MTVLQVADRLSTLTSLFKCVCVCVCVCCVRVSVGGCACVCVHVRVRVRVRVGAIILSNIRNGYSERRRCVCVCCGSN